MTSDNLFAVPIFRRGLFPLSLLILVTAAVCSGADLEIVASDEPDWPQFRGPRRDGVCDETGLLGSWSEGGPALVWKTDRVGRGYSSPIIVEDTLYITGDVGEDHLVFAFNLDGTLKWKTTNGRFWEKPWGGARTSCTYDDGRLYQMNAHGRVVCLDPNDGKEIWSVNVLERFGAKNITWAVSECLVIDRDRLIVTPGGPKTFMAALDKGSGETVWTTDPIRFTRSFKPGNKPVDSPHKDTDKPGYAPPILFQCGSRRLVAGCAGLHHFLVDADAGELIWTQYIRAGWEVIANMPIVYRDSIIFSSARTGCERFRLSPRPGRLEPEKLWKTRVYNTHGSLVAVGNRLYGSGHRPGGWGATDLDSGTTLYSIKGLSRGVPLYADGHVYALGEKGTMTLLRPGSESFEIVGKFEVPKGSLSEDRQRDVWTHPVIHRARLYLRNHDLLLCYDIKAPPD